MFRTGIPVEPTVSGIAQENTEDHVASVPSSEEEEGAELDENAEIEALEKRAFDDDEGIISDKK